MGYSKQLYEQALATLAARREKSESEAAAVRERAIQKDPRIGEITRLLSANSLSLIHAVLNGIDGKPTDVQAAARECEQKSELLQKELAERLHKAGERADNFEPIPYCAACRDTGYVGQKMCRCMEDLLRDGACRELSRLSDMSLTDFRDMSLDYYSNTAEENGISPRERMSQIIAYCRAWAEDFSVSSPSLLLRGPAGTGKTHVSLAIARIVAESGHLVIYGSTQRLLRQIEKEHFGKEDGGSIEQMTACDLLILDDLGTEFASPFYTSALYEIINGRMLSGRPTLLSTNLNQKQLQERYGVQIASRIGGCFEPLLFVGNDIRQEKLMRRLADNT